MIFNYASAVPDPAGRYANTNESIKGQLGQARPPSAQPASYNELDGFNPANLDSGTGVAVPRGAFLSVRRRSRLAIDNDTWAAWGGWEDWSYTTLADTGLTSGVDGVSFSTEGFNEYEFRVHYMPERWRRAHLRRGRTVGDVIDSTSAPVVADWVEFDRSAGWARDAYLAGTSQGARLNPALRIPGLFRRPGEIVLRHRDLLSAFSPNPPLPLMTINHVRAVGVGRLAFADTDTTSSAASPLFRFPNDMSLRPPPTDSAGRYWLAWVSDEPVSPAGSWATPLVETNVPYRPPGQSNHLLVYGAVPEVAPPPGVYGAVLLLAPGGAGGLLGYPVAPVGFEVGVVDSVTTTIPAAVSVPRGDRFKKTPIGAFARDFDLLGDGTNHGCFVRCAYQDTGTTTAEWLDLPATRPEGYQWWRPLTWPVSATFSLTPVGTPGRAGRVIQRMFAPFLYTPGEAAAGIEPHMVNVTAA